MISQQRFEAGQAEDLVEDLLDHSLLDVRSDQHPAVRRVVELGTSVCFRGVGEYRFGQTLSLLRVHRRSFSGLIAPNALTELF
ncbi:hypothetical protein Lesp02_42700 [Lentzea sp. NBRC 105346]|nr:hypothetical protein Lesp02_42700 [Lentzea sp. NBRC 105346]